jgi:outer membrane protein OmpA-like peptidoglycan-associated protein
MAKLMKALALAASMAASAATAATPPAGHVNFVACPIVRDTKTVPCWLSEYGGKTYFLGIQFDATAEFYPPYLGHKALVEGVISKEPDVCGGIVLKPLKVSVIPDLDPTCETLLPASDKYQIPDAPRGPGPRYHAQTYNAPPPAPPPTPPYQAKDFIVLYDYDSELGARSLQAITQAMLYAKAVKASHVQVTGYESAPLLSDGTRLPEEPWIAEHRAERLAVTLAQIGVPASIISADWKAKPEPGTGADDYKLRRVVVHVVP